MQESDAAQDVILKFEIVPGLSPEATSITDAIEAWVDILTAAAQIVEPGSTLSVKLVGVESGSQVFKFALDKLEAFGNQLAAGADQYPLVSKTAMTLASLITGAVIGVAVTSGLESDPRIPDDQMQVFKEMNEHLGESAELQRRNEAFFLRLERERAISEVKVLRGDRTPAYTIPRSEFQARSGLWSAEEPVPVRRAEHRTEVWDVVLIKPVMVAEPRRWTFTRDGLQFTALMKDEAVLAAIHDRTLPIQIAEGIMMKVEVRWREKYDGHAWLPSPQSRTITKVLVPRIAGAPLPLFSSASLPQEED